MPFSSLNDPVDVARAQVAEDAVKRFVLANAPAYQHPRRVFFEKSMPLAATNKVDRAALRRAALQRIGETAVA